MNDEADRRPPARPPEWVRRCRAAALGAPPSNEEGLDVFRGRWPRALLYETVRVLLTVTLSATAAAMAFFRWHTHGPDALALLAELVALAAALRTVAAVFRWGCRVRDALRATRWALVCCPQGLWVHTPAGEWHAPREALLDARAEGTWARRAGPDRWSTLWLLFRPDAAPPGPLPWLALPPVFERPPAALAEWLMRWRGPLPSAQPPASPSLPSRVYEEVAAGRPCRGCVALRLRFGWLQEAPMWTPLFGLVLLHVAWFAAHAPVALEGNDASLFAALGVALWLPPLSWVLLAWRRLRHRHGLAMLLHPGALLLRQRGGVTAVPWRDVRRVAVEERPAWNVWRGGHHARRLVLERAEGPAVRYEAAWLGVPVEPLASLCEAYRRGLVLSERHSD